jgi:hypothetical protein
MTDEQKPTSQASLESDIQPVSTLVENEGEEWGSDREELQRQ